jgi:hypothetical protein
MCFFKEFLYALHIHLLMKLFKYFVALSKPMEYGNFNQGELDGRDLKTKIRV